MDASDPQYSFASRIVQQLRAAGAVAYWAGGCVRDLLRKAPPGDYDVATSATPDQVRELFGRRRTLAVGESFGVIIVLPPEGLDPVEVATFRTEGPYRDGRRPESVVFATAEEDAHRRDFTINGMFFDPLAGEVLDFVGGQADLAAGIVRAIGDPRARMREDKLRLLRAVRFAAVFDFQLDPATSAAVREMAGELSVVSVERIAQELRKMLLHSNRRRAIELCRDHGLLEVILPGWMALDKSPDETLDLLQRLQQPTIGLSLAVLMRRFPNPRVHRKAPDPPESVRSHCRRLKLSNEETDSCLWLHAHQQDFLRVEELPDADLKRLLANPLSAELRKWLEAESQRDPVARAAQSHLAGRTATWTADLIDPPPFITGDNLIQRGLKPGPQLRDLLDLVRTAQLNGEVSTQAEAERLVDRWIEGRRSDPEGAG